jgi:hypothetical protein
VIRTEPAGATVFIDGKLQAKKADGAFVVRAGKHTLKVVLEEYHPIEKEVLVPAGEEVTAEFYLSKRAPEYETISIRTNPPGAIVYVDGKPQKKKTPGNYVFRVGRHHLKITYPHYKTEEDNHFRVEKGDAENERELVLSLTEVIPPRTVRPFRGQRDPSQTLREQLAPVVRVLARGIKENGNNSLALADFADPVDPPSSGGTLIAKVLAEELENHALRIDPSAKVHVQGKYRLVEDKKSKLAAVRIEATVTDANGKVLHKINQKVFGESLIGALLGVTANLPLTTNERDRCQVMVQSTEKPAVTVEGDQVAPSATSPYAVEVLAASGPNPSYQAVTPQVHNGLAYLALKKDHVFAIKLINNSDQEAAVTLTIDGVNTFAFSAQEKGHKQQYNLWFVPPKKTITVRGWFYDEDRLIPFTPEKFPRLGGFTLPVNSKVGAITATFAASWFKWNQPPADEPKYKVWNEDCTRGPRINPLPLKEETKVNYGLIRAMVTVRYKR